ncbi:MAG: DMT family transporter [Janthinobacterium lividum]
MSPTPVRLTRLETIHSRSALSAAGFSVSTIGFAGVLIVSTASLHVGAAPLWTYALPVMGMLSLALATLLQARSGKGEMPVHQRLRIQCLSATAIFATLASNEGSVVPLPERGFVLGIFWLTLLATFGGYGLYYLCLRRSSPTRVSSALYLSPPVTMLWAWAMFAEPLSAWMHVGLLVSLAGAVVVARAQTRPTAAP